MHLEQLSVVDWRSYASADVALGPGVRVLLGPNAQGKTNLLEAVHYLATGASHRVASDAPLVRSGAPAAVLRAQARVGEDARRATIELEIRPGARSRAQVNGQPQRRVADAVGIVRAVLFAPEDLALVRGDPADRRRFLDGLLAQRRPAYAAARGEYERVLRQRNQLLKDARRRATGADATLSDWTDALARAGATLLAARIAVVHALAGPTAAAYRELLAGPAGPEAADDVALAYESSTGRRIPAEPSAGVPDPAELVEELRVALAERADEEVDRGITLVGPHRDELALAIGDLPARGYASHGECWSLALALRLASREVLREVGDEPIVVLDDVFAELDATRRARLAERCRGFEQVLISAAVDDDVPLDGARYRVRAGTVIPLAEEVA
ncbi:MAG: DNA replication/repair protein RecF [Actinomycetota bacterium]